MELQKAKPRKIDPNLKRTLKHGWMVNQRTDITDITTYPWLFMLDAMTWQRWDYWYRTCVREKLLDEPIPQIEFETGPGSRFEGEGSNARKHLEECLNLIPQHGTWNGWGSWVYFDYFLDWLLYAFGYHGQKELPSEGQGCEGASMRLYQYFNLAWLMAYPWDYFGAILAENKHGQNLGFYPTPMCVVNMMAQITFGDSDNRLKSVNEPCVGTGRMLLYASNYSLILSGQDINLTCVKATLVNGYLYAPWLVRPLDCLERDSRPPTPLKRPTMLARPTTLPDQQPKHLCKESLQSPL
jgi:hypothetical protein